MMQKIDYSIRDALVDDAQFIAGLEKACFSSPWSVGQIVDEINKDNVIFLSAVADDKLCGYISGQLILDEFYISNVAVEEKFRKSGIATALVNELINRLKNENCAFLTLEVRVSNVDARRVYEKSGFVNLGIRKNFYSHPVEDACIYTLYFSEESDKDENSCN